MCVEVLKVGSEPLELIALLSLVISTVYVVSGYCLLYRDVHIDEVNLLGLSVTLVNLLTRGSNRKRVP